MRQTSCRYILRRREYLSIDPFWHSTQTATNITGYANVKIDKLLEDGRQELDPAKRKSIYADFQRYLTEDVPAIFMYYPNSFTVTRNAARR